MPMLLTGTGCTYMGATGAGACFLSARALARRKRMQRTSTATIRRIPAAAAPTIIPGWILTGSLKNSSSPLGAFCSSSSCCWPFPGGPLAVGAGVGVGVTCTPVIDSTPSSLAMTFTYRSKTSLRYTSFTVSRVVAVSPE
eukprot:CAMPEP_0198726388 /NCGR_PEP_ID=MMETSP1475-20131203/3449_1 /TAXON_ID= ORGANISM="Unidentified sp., Strain CCMP1999" /NCGR_SAMPLE_ID=MMETSP1475 /ASSEMBLY_ACC=CAM_ASM_001111 /LENGTH=139 /DNA_ID=CAMNT_0044488295 /DNA_START=85 /DNA_END=504 /DNA_ORIENTATION=+